MDHGESQTTVTAAAPPARTALRAWGSRQWVTAAVGAGATALAIGLPTDVLPNPVFGRPVDVTWWSPWVLVVTAVLGGLVLATYVAVPGSPTAALPESGSPEFGSPEFGSPESGLASDPPQHRDASHAGGVSRNPVADERPARLASVGGLLGFLAVGCPVCNKLVVVALGTTGALSWFAPIQPVLAVASVVVLAIALRTRLRGQVACPVS
jgi:hypothetical protein